MPQDPRAPDPAQSEDDRGPAAREFSTPRKQDPAARLEGAKGVPQDGSDPSSRSTASDAPATDERQVDDGASGAPKRESD